jgi:hypothetical protein
VKRRPFAPIRFFEYNDLDQTGREAYYRQREDIWSIMRNQPRRLRIVVSDEETGEEVITATGVETLILLVAPDTSRDQEYRRILIGDLEMTVQLLFDILKDVTERIGRGTIVDLSKILDDSLLLEVTEELPSQ